MPRKSSTRQDPPRRPKPDPGLVAKTSSRISVGNISDVSGEVNIAAGDIYIGHSIGYTLEQVSSLITQISATFQPKQFDGRSPYKGLDVFEETDAELFFGREKLVEVLIERVKTNRTIFITGPSGSGKSSLVRAGLLYSLKQGAIKEAHSEDWLYATIKPGREPIEALALTFSRLRSPELGNYFRQHISSSNILNECAESVLNENHSQRFVLYIDQFEEVFTQVSREYERVTFLNLLTNAAKAQDGRVIFLFSMRSDFISTCAAYSDLNEMLNNQFIQIGAMQPSELVSAIAQPALRVGLRIDPDLIAQIVNDMQGEPGALPLMQFALKDLFDSQLEKGELIALTLNDYMEHGGIHKSLERHADKIFATLNANEQEIARSIFSSLIQIGRGTQDTRRTATFDELIPLNRTSTAVEAVVRKLADARLVTTDEFAGKNTITLAHEKLLDAWTWLRRLVNENRDTIATQNEIAEDVKTWDEHKRDASYLYSGTRLKGMQEWTKKHPELLSPLTIEFVKESQTRKNRESTRWAGVLGLSGFLAMMIYLTLAGELNRFIYKPVDMEDYWVTIPAGEFQMGSEIGSSFEQPVHPVYLNEYQIGKYEVTYRQYAQCMKAGICFGSYYGEERELHPVGDVTWYDAITYCEWVGGRLPTEAEWEKAASWDDQQKTKRTYPWGETIDCSYANFSGKDGGNDFCVGDTMPVGSYESGKSPYGLYDMAGNVLEWVSTLYRPYPYDANDGREDMNSSYDRLMRGGAWTDHENLVRSDRRSRGIPWIAFDYIGFRCSRSP